MLAAVPVEAVELLSHDLLIGDEIVIHRPCSWPRETTIDVVRGEKVLVEVISVNSVDPVELVDQIADTTGLVLTWIQEHNYNQGDGECDAFVVE
jgi:hypothetical protein